MRRRVTGTPRAQSGRAGHAGRGRADPARAGRAVGARLQPAAARAIQGADLVVWVGEGLETFMVRPLETLGEDAGVLELAEAPGVELLPLRSGGDWAAHDHGHEHGHAEDGDAHHRDDAGHAQADEDGHGHDEHDHHDHSHDMHLWLSPANGKAILRAVADKLAAIDPANAATYAGNAETAIDGLDRLDAELADEIAPSRGKPYIVFHDAYHYFEDAYDPRPAEVAIEGSDARAGVLDPTGAALTPGPAAYGQLLQGLAHDLNACLTGSS
ncbi:zinc ABC transporter substrate-binding protein [Marinivivus vitaminiproducens]|uniref:zinc ABC transporter substrate-binding protein n=1 Tax=Marinivivus vitaminiproducens TaxID=3035935 RepID=UPI00279F29F6|nr:zinc ABC transporter substrate-binding protein [Geminicoccaceae bacterium SCSIO 64248]